VKLLEDKTSATALFRRSAGLHNPPPGDLLSIEGEIVEACKGLPLALHVTGGLLGMKKMIEKQDYMVLARCYMCRLHVAMLAAIEVNGMPPCCRCLFCVRHPRSEFHV
jgi:hypothetical protein